VARRKLLIISYVFPPVGGIMVQRVLSFARYLPEHDIDVHVLSCWNPATPVYDPGLLKLVPPQVKSYHAFTPEPPFYLRKKVWSLIVGQKSTRLAQEPPRPSTSAWKRAIKDRLQRVLSPDAQVLWVPFAVRKAARIVRQHAIDTVLVTAPPFSLFLAGRELKQRFPHLRLISDFRDEWLRFMLTDFDHYAGDSIRQSAERIERETVEGSDLVVAVTRSSLEEIRARYPALPASRFALVPNGYDPALFRNFHSRQHGGSRIVVTHNGTAYRTSSPVYYLDALDGMPDAIRSGIETRFIGRVAETEAPLFKNRQSPIRLYGFLPQVEALRQVEETDYLLLTMTNDFSLPGKLFEYLATGKPVLALSPSGGEVDRLLRETQGGWCVPHDNPPAIRGMLERVWQHRCQHAPQTQVDWEAIRRYERPRIAADFAARMLELS
jgi:glycosyltransferase involved in cell wall biosynthesis